MLVSTRRVEGTYTFTSHRYWQPTPIRPSALGTHQRPSSPWMAGVRVAGPGTSGTEPRGSPVCQVSSVTVLAVGAHRAKEGRPASALSELPSSGPSELPSLKVTPRSAREAASV